ncbi:MAG: hypothetical protein AB8U44_01815 [Aaplasma endosymbiont of Hyalomma asiaticum]
MPGENSLDKIDGYKGSGVSSIGKTKILAKFFVIVLAVSAAVYGYCIAYAVTAGIHLLSSHPIVIGSFISLAALLLSTIGVVIYTHKIGSIDKYDMSIVIPGGNFDRGRLLVKEGLYVKGGAIKADITVNGVANRGLAAFNTMSAVLTATMILSLCGFASTLGILVARHQGLQGVIGVLSSPADIVARCCLGALAVFVSAAITDILKNELCDSGSRLLVLEEGIRRATDDDIAGIAKGLGVSSTNIAHVRICRSAEPENTYVSV